MNDYLCPTDAPAVAKLFHRRNPRFAGLTWHIHLAHCRMRRHSWHRINWATELRKMRRDFPRP